jgi:hypothetical protein
LGEVCSIWWPGLVEPDPTAKVKELFSTDAILPETDCVWACCDSAEFCLVAVGAGTAKVAAARAKLAKADTAILISFFIGETSWNILRLVLCIEHKERHCGDGAHQICYFLWNRMVAKGGK